MLICASLFTLVCFQTYRFAAVLDIQSITSASIQSERLRNFAETSVTRLNTHIRM